MRLAELIESDLPAILVEWEDQARRMVGSGAKPSTKALINHGEQILRAIVRGMANAQSDVQRDAMAGGLDSTNDLSFAAAHGAIRQLMGFSLVQLVGEFRALRASVLRRYESQASGSTATIVYDISRFTEGVDQALAESSSSYAAKAAESRDTFLAILGHDLRSPLGSLLNCLHLLAQANVAPPSRNKIIEIGVRSGESMDEMIGQLIDFSRRSLGRGLDVHPRPGNIGGVCEGALEEIRIAHPDVKLAYEATGDLALSFDPPRMRQVLINLLANAVQHGDVHESILVSAAGQARGVTLTVLNQGPPIESDSVMSIFDPLVRKPSATENTSKPSTSLGLGLFIAREIVNAHGGRIEVASTSEDGTAFSVFLPRFVSVESASSPD